MESSIAANALRLQAQYCDIRNGGYLQFSQNAAMDIAEIKGRLKKSGKTQAGLAAALHVNPSAVNRLLKGERALKLHEVEKVRAYLDSPPDSVTTSANLPDTNVSQRIPYPQGTERLRVLGMAECGPDGWNIWNGDVVGYVATPPNLLGVPDAYAVYISGTSMEPRFILGELAHIHPHKPVTPGCYVLVQRKPKGPGEPPLAVIKQLIRRSGSKVALKQLNPPETFDIRADEIVTMHRVVGSQEG